MNGNRSATLRESGEMLNLAVLACDRDQPDRGKGMARAFQMAGSRDVFFFDGERVFHFSGNGCQEVVAVPATFDIVVVHNSDAAACSDALRTCGMAIRYTAGSPPEDIAGDELWIRARSIAGAADVLTVAEAREVADWVLNGAPLERTPAVLRSGFAANYLSALLVLCQGYLVVHVSPEGNLEEVDDGDEVSSALEEMGWMGLETDARALLVDPLRDEDADREPLRLEVRGEEAEYWKPMRVLTNDEMTTSREDTRPKGMRKVSKTCLLEWQALTKDDELPESVSRLLKLVCEHGQTVGPPSLVASAFLDLLRAFREAG